MKKQLQIITTLILVATFSMSGGSQNIKRLSDFPEHFKERKPFKRFAWDYTQRAYPYDTVPYTRAIKTYNKEIDRILSLESRQNPLIEWNPRGPAGVLGTGYYSNWGVVSGRIRAIAVHPIDPLTVYIGAASGGLWKTIDGGNTWMDIGKDLGSLNYGAIAIDPDNPDVIYAGSGETIYSLSPDMYSGKGLYKSSDGGITWEVITDGFDEDTHFADIAICPHNSDVIIAALTCSSYSLGYNLPNEGIWKSTDAGQTWVKTLDLPYGCDVMFHPDDPNTAYASIGGMHNESGFYISNDEGDTWTISNDGIPDPTALSRMLFDISMSNPYVLYAVAYEPVNDKRERATYTNAYKSVNGGETWQQISAGIPLGGYGGGWYDQGWYDLCIAVDPLDSDHVYIGNIELHETTDGETYFPVRPYGNDARGSIVHFDYHRLVFDPTNPEYLFIGCDGGIYKYDLEEDTAYSWNDGLETFQFYRMGSHPTNPDAMIAGSQDNGTMMTWNGEDSWIMVMVGDGMECFFDRADPDNKIYGARQYGILMRSENGGATFSTWKTIEFPRAWITPYFNHSTDDGIFYSASDDIYRYPHTAGPLVWERITSDLMPVEIFSMDQSKVNPHHMILAGFDEDQFFIGGIDTVPIMISTDGGFNWTNVTANIPGEKRWIPKVLCDPLDAYTMYIVRNGFSEGNKIYVTTDLGETWDNISGDLPDIPCLTMFVNPFIPNQIFVGTDLGIYISDDWGETYYYGGGDMPLVPIQDFEYVEIGNKGYLRVATYGRSIYETIFTGVDIVEKSSQKVNSLKIYPNPCEGAVRLRYQIPDKGLSVRSGAKAGYQILDLYSISGLKIKRLLNEMKPAGTYELEVDMTGFPAGVYFCTLKSEDWVETVKIIKL